MRVLIVLTCIVVLIAHSRITFSVLGTVTVVVVAAVILLAAVSVASAAKEIVGMLATDFVGSLLSVRDGAVRLVERRRRRRLSHDQEAERARRVAAATARSISLLREHVEGKRRMGVVMGVTLVGAYWRVVFDYGRGRIRPALEAALPAAFDQDAELVIVAFDYDRMVKEPERKELIPMKKVYAYRLSEGCLHPLPARGMRVATAMAARCSRDGPAIEHVDAPALGSPSCSSESGRD